MKSRLPMVYIPDAFYIRTDFRKSKKDKQWETAIMHQLKQHAWFLKKSNSAARDEWCSELKSLITIVVYDYEKLDSHAVKT